MSINKDEQILLDLNASDLAFHVGQIFEKLLLDRGMEKAKAAQTAFVTIEHVESSIDESIIEELRRKLNERKKQEAATAT